jgi:hypothetical protein
MQMLYNSENFAVVQIDVPQPDAALEGASSVPTKHRGGYEIVDKYARREIYLDGAMAAQFKLDVEDLISHSPSEEEVDSFLERFSGLAQQPVVLH